MADIFVIMSWVDLLDYLSKTKDQIMKQLLMVLAIIGGLSFSSAANYHTVDKPGKHHCTAACTKDKHVYAHGEKGHVCKYACKKGKS